MITRFLKSSSALLISLLLTMIGVFPAFGDGAAASCGIDTSCTLEDGRSYRTALPDGWNGEDPLTVLIHFHGWGRTGANVINNKRVAGATRENGVLLLAPDGLRKSWSFWNAPSRDVPFVDAMIEDAAKRFPINRERVYVSGYSYGAAMAWRLACERGKDFAGFLTIAGTLWNLEELERCPAPITLRHVHGLKDTVMDLPVGDGGDLLHAVYPWLQLAGCVNDERETSQIGDFSNTKWQACSTRHTVELDLHDGGHFIPAGWMSRQLKRLQNNKSN